MQSRALGLKVIPLVGVVVLLSGCMEPVVYTPLPPSVPQPRLPRNDVYEGSVITRSLRPRFVWEASTGAKGPVRYELQYSPDPTFAAETVTVETMELSHQPESNLPVSMIPPVGRRYYWRARACGEKLCSEYSRPWWVNLGRSDKDYNGDGYADVVVGAPSNDDNGIRDAGKVYVYFGGPGSTFDPVPDTPVGSMAGAAADDRFGAAVSSAGDFNGDGYADIVAGAWGNDAGGNFAGRAYVYFGGAGSKLDPTADAILTGAAARHFFGEAVAAAGDVNGDGFSDVLIGAPTADAGGAGSGRAYLFFGGKAGPYDGVDGQMTGRAGDGLGTEVIGLGDVNGDGFADVAASSHGAKGSNVHIYLGRPEPWTDEAAILVLAGNQVFDLNAAIAAGGDFDRDGFADIAVGISSRDNPEEAGRTHVYRGGKILDDVVDRLLMGTAASDKLGYSVAAGDVNGDSYDDLIVGAQVIDGGGVHSGRADIYLGQPEGLLSPLPSARLNGRTANDLFCKVASSGGDVNGDGYDDVVVGAPNDSSIAIGEGRAYVFLGNATGLVSDVAAGTLNAAVAESFFGESIAQLSPGSRLVYERSGRRGSISQGRTPASVSLAAAGFLKMMPFTPSAGAPLSK